MSGRAVAVVGGGASFVLAAVAGVVGNQLRVGAWWPWLAFVVILAVGVAVTTVVVYRTVATDSMAGPFGRGVTHCGNVTVGEVRTTNGPAVGINYGTIGSDPQSGRRS